MNVLRPEKKDCPDCAVKPDEYHTLGCDVERCMVCGGQLIGCDCNGTSLDNDAREVWTGFWPGERRCHELGWVDAAGNPDLNKLVTHCRWNELERKWIPEDGARYLSTTADVQAALKATQERHQKAREADRLAYAALPKDQKYQQRRCPRCGQTDSLMPDQICLDCHIKESLSNRPEFESKPYYQIEGDILTWLFEPVPTVTEWHKQGGFHTLHAHDDKRVVGFEIWWVSEFCAQLFALITEGADDALDRYRKSWRDKMDRENNWGADALICTDTGERPVHGSCPTHGGDNCLRHPHAAPIVRELEASRDSLEHWRTIATERSKEILRLRAELESIEDGRAESADALRRIAVNALAIRIPLASTHKKPS